MRRVIALLMLTACGRLGFDAFGDGGQIADDDGGGSGSGSGSGSSGACVSPGYGDSFDEVLPCNMFGMPVVTNGGMTTTNGTLTITPNANANTMVGCARGSSAFGDAGAFVEVSQAAPSPAETALVVSVGAKTAAITVIAPFIAYLDPNANTVMTSYDPQAMRWWRLRPVGTMLYAETAPDGKTWTRFASSGNGFTGTGTVSIYVQTDAGNAAPGSAKIEGIDICPP